MAAATNQVLINSVQQAAKAAGVAATWATSGAALNVRDSFLYEMHVLLEIADLLAGAWKLDYVAGTGAKAHEFPKGPADKTGRPRFNLVNAGGGVDYQLCGGTRVTDSHNVGRAIDVSLQVGSAGDAPTNADLVRAYDAKYRSDPADQISHPEVSEFGKWIELFLLRGANPPIPALSHLDAHCVISNGAFSTEPDSVLTHLNIKEVQTFFPGNAGTARP